MSAPPARPRSLFPSSRTPPLPTFTSRSSFSTPSARSLSTPSPQAPSPQSRKLRGPAALAYFAAAAADGGAAADYGIEHLALDALEEDMFDRFEFRAEIEVYKV